MAFPLIGAGSGGGSAKEAERLMLDEMDQLSYAGEVFVVRYAPAAASDRGA